MTFDSGTTACNDMNTFASFEKCALIGLRFFLKKLSKKFEESEEPWDKIQRDILDIDIDSDEDVQILDRDQRDQLLQRLTIINIQLKLYSVYYLMLESIPIRLSQKKDLCP